MLIILAVGILVASTLLALSPIYTRVMTDLGLTSSLEEQLRSASRMSVIRFDLPLGSHEAADIDRSLARMTAEETSWFAASEARYGALPDLTYAREGQPVPTNRDRTTVTLQTLSGLEDHVRVHGRLPRGSDDAEVIEVALSVEAGRVLGLNPGDRFAAVHTFDDCNRPPPTDDPDELRERARFPCVPRVFVTLRATFVVTGLIEPRDQEEAYWSAGRFSFAPPIGTETTGPVFGAVMDEESFFRALPRVMPGIRSEFRITAFADITRLDTANIDRARESLARLRERAIDAGALADIPMANALANFHSRASFNQVPLLLLLLQVVGIALYYVVLVASMLVDRRSEEIAMLRSRGASVLQVVAGGVIEAAVIGAGATVAAPFLAAGAVALLGKTGRFEELSGGGFLPFTVVPSAFLLAAAGAGLAVVAVTVPTFFAARRGMLLFLGGVSRPGKPLLQRYYLDVAVAGVAAVAFWELNQRGTVFDPRSVGGWSADPLLLLSPLLLVLAIGALVFRFMPFVVGLVGQLWAGSGGPGVALGLLHLTRSPASYAHLTLLVVMGAAVGTFAATYGQTTDRSQVDRALFSAGADARLVGLGKLSGQSPQEVRQALIETPGVQQAATAYRASQSLGPLPGFGSSLQVLAVDPDLAPELLWFRDDFADEGISPLLRRIAGSPAGGQGMALPGEPTAISVWVNPSAERGTSTLWARTLDANGVFRLHELGTLGFTGYRKLVAGVEAIEGVVYPLSLVGLVMTQPSSFADPARSAVALDDLAVVDRDGTETVVEDFEGSFRWETLRTATRNRDSVEKVDQGAHRGSGAALYGFRIGSAVSVRGLAPGDPNIPLPAIASRRLLQATGAKVGDEIELVMGSMVMPVSIRGVTDLFPTMSDSDTGFLVLNERHLYFYAGLINQQGLGGPNEAWLQLPADSAAREETFRALQERFEITPNLVVDSEKMVQEVRSDPVVRAGGSGVLLVALAAALSVVLLGFGLTLYLGAQGRTVEMSVMRAVGISRRQILAMVAFEYLVVAAIGLVVGTLAGLRISATMLSFLNVTESGSRVVPPYTLATEWDIVAAAFGGLLLAFAGGIAALATYFLRLPMSRVLRLTR